MDNLLQTGVTGAAAIASAAPFRLVDGYPSGLLDPTTLSPTISRRAQDANQRTPYIQQFNIGVQHELWPDVVLDVAYVGNKGTKLNGFRNLNQRAVITNPTARPRAPGPTRRSATSSGWRTASARATTRSSCAWRNGSPAG